MALPKWTEERVEALTTFVGNETPVSQETVAGAAEHLETSTRSVSSKLRKMGFEVQLASERASRSFSPEQEATLSAFVTGNSGEYTYAQIAEHFEGGIFNAKSIQGKILSMELTGHVKPAPKVESVKTYTDAEEEKMVSMCNSGCTIEALAEAMGREVASVRGKALSLLRAERITSIPKQEHTKGTSKADPFEGLGDLAAMTVQEIADAVDPVKTPRGIKTMLTRRGLVAADYDGAARAAKAAE